MKKFDTYFERPTSIDALIEVRRRNNSLLQTMNYRKNLDLLYEGESRIKYANLNQIGELKWQDRNVNIFRDKNKIGSGVYGKVFKCKTPTRKNTMVAIKTVDLEIGHNPNHPIRGKNTTCPFYAS